MRLGPVPKAYSAVFVASPSFCFEMSGALLMPEERAEKHRVDITNVDSVVLTSSDDLKITVGNKASATASGDPRALSTLELKVINGALRIGRIDGIHRDNGASVIVTLLTVRKIEIDRSGHVDIDAFTTAVIEGRVSGSGSLRLKALNTGEARFVVNGAGDVALHDTNVDTLFLNSNGVGDILAVGQARKVSINLNGSGTVDSRSIETRELVVNSRGSGAVSARAIDQASANAQGAGGVSIVGGARCSVSKNSLNEVTCI